MRRFLRTTRAREFLDHDAYGAERPPFLTDAEPAPWTADYPAEYRTLLPPRAGYVYRPAGPDPLREPSQGAARHLRTHRAERRAQKVALQKAAPSLQGRGGDA